MCRCQDTLLLKQYTPKKTFNFFSTISTTSILPLLLHPNKPTTHTFLKSKLIGNISSLLSTHHPQHRYIHTPHTKPQPETQPPNYKTTQNKTKHNIQQIQQSYNTASQFANNNKTIITHNINNKNVPLLLQLDIIIVVPAVIILPIVLLLLLGGSAAALPSSE